MEVNLSKLTKAEKLALIDELDEHERRERKRKPPFVPFDKQVEIIKSPALEKYLFCGNGFSKTALLCALMHYAATGYNPVTKEHTPVPSIIYLVVDDPSKIEQKIIPEYRKWFDLDSDNIHKDGKPHPSRFSYKNGSVIHIVTHEVNLLKVEGVEMTHLFFDEPPPRHVFVGLYRGGRIEGRPLQVFMAGTPLYQAWLRTDVYEPWLDGELEDVECFSGSSADNPHLEEGYLKRFSRNLSEDERATRLHGAFFDASGQALAHLYDPKLHLLERDYFNWEYTNPCVVIMDPHPSKAHCAVLLGADQDNYLYVLDEFKAKKKARDFTKALIERGWWSSYRPVDVVYDSLGSTDGTGQEGFKSFGKVVNEVLRASGLGRARATTFEEKDDEAFIERMRDTLGVPEEPNKEGKYVPKLRILSDCYQTIRDVKQVQWQRDRKSGESKPKLEISNQDMLACVKYGLATNLHKDKGKKKVMIQSDRTPYGVTLGKKPKVIKLRSRRLRSRV